jgi:hypothetical protein
MVSKFASTSGVNLCRYVEGEKAAAAAAAAAGNDEDAARNNSAAALAREAAAAIGSLPHNATASAIEALAGAVVNHGDKLPSLASVAGRATLAPGCKIGYYVTWTIPAVITPIEQCFDCKNNVVKSANPTRRPRRQLGAAFLRRARAGVAPGHPGRGLRQLSRVVRLLHHAVRHPGRAPDHAAGARDGGEGWR